MKLTPRSVTPFFNYPCEKKSSGNLSDDLDLSSWDGLLIVAMTLLMLACFYLLFASPAHAEGPATAPVVSTTDTVPAYVGAEKCKMCHLAAYKTWAATGMAKAWDRIKEAADKDKCVKCHTTGHGLPGGFTSVEATPTDRTEEVSRAPGMAQERPNLTGVQCEVCHGPGGAHVALPISQKDPAVRKATINKHIQDCRQCHSPHVADKAAAARAGSEK